MLESVTAPLRSILSYSRVLWGASDAYRYARLRRQHRLGAPPGPPVAIRVRALGGAPVLCRASQDVWTFKHTFLDRFHLPPVELPAHATILDLGSNVGYTVAHLAYTYPSARVVGVEMDARNLDLARRNTAHFGPRVTVVHAAVWTEDGEVAYSGEADDAFQVDASPSGRARSAPARRLETILAECGIERVDYLKMDIEGAEAAILAGEMEWARRVHALKIELHPPATYDACRAALEPLGFRCWRDARHWDTLCAVPTR